MSYRRLFALISLFFCAACETSPKGGIAGKTFRVNLSTEPPSLDWSLATDHVSFNVIANLMVGLAEFDKQLKPAPVIAKSWDIARRRAKAGFSFARRRFLERR